MALKNPYCSVEQVQEELRNEDVALEPTIEDAINSASRFIDGYKGRDYFFHDYSDTDSPLTIYSGMEDGVFYRNFLTLPYSPIIALTTVTVNGTVWTENVDFIKQATRLVSINGHWPTSGVSSSIPTASFGCSCVPAKVEIVGTFGYVQDDEGDVPTGIPSDIVRACVVIAAACTGHNQKQVATPEGNFSAIYDKNIPKVAFDILGKRYMPI